MEVGGRGQQERSHHSAMLALLGDRVNKFRVIRRDFTPKDTGMLATISRFVMRRAIPVFIVTLVALGGLVALGHNFSFGLVDERVLAKTDQAAIASSDETVSVAPDRRTRNVAPGPVSEPGKTTRSSYPSGSS